MTYFMTVHIAVKVFELLNEADKNWMLPMLFGSLVSADVLTSADACRKSIEMLEDFREAMPESKVMNKDIWMKFISEGLEIARKDLEKFEK